MKTDTVLNDERPEIEQDLCGFGPIGAVASSSLIALAWDWPINIDPRLVFQATVVQEGTFTKKVPPVYLKAYSTTECAYIRLLINLR